MSSQYKIEYKPNYISEFIIDKAIGDGGLASVYLCKKKDEQKIKALKCIDISNMGGVEFDDEFKYHSICASHPNILDIYEGWYGDRYVYLLLEYVPGKNLYEYMCNKEYEKIDEVEAEKIVAQISDAIKFCHKNNVVHRDIKPENILISKDGVIKLIDFGLAFDANSTKTGSVGTIDYMAPEVIMQRPHTKKIDWWSLGVLYYEIVTGELPFYDCSTNKTKKLILNCELNFPQYMSENTRSDIRKLININSKERIVPRKCTYL